MIQKRRFNYQVKRGKKTITAFGGLGFVGEMGECLGIWEDLERGLEVKERKRGYAVSEMVMDLVMLSAAGGECLDDLRILGSDEGLKLLTGQERLPAANTAGEFLRKMGRRDIRVLRRGQQKIVREVLEKKKIKKITLDVDATLLESEKAEAKMSYKGERGYMPLLCYIPEVDLFQAGVFRPGNASPGANAVSFLRLCLEGLPSGKKVYLRSDSAWYNESVFAMMDEEGIGFTVGAKDHGPLTEAAWRIPDEKWSRLPKTKSGEQLAETSHVIGEKGIPRRVVIIRKPKEQPDFFEGEWSYRFIITNLNWKAKKIVFWHRKRAASENAFKELKEGYGLKRLPCGTLLANAAWFQIVLLSHNLVRALQVLVLPEGWRYYRVKNLRFRLFGIAGWVVRHAREVTLHVSMDYPFWNVFKLARWRLIGLASE